MLSRSQFKSTQMWIVDFDIFDDHVLPGVGIDCPVYEVPNHNTEVPHSTKESRTIGNFVFKHVFARKIWQRFDNGTAAFPEDSCRSTYPQCLRDRARGARWN